MRQPSGEGAAPDPKPHCDALAAGLQEGSRPERLQHLHKLGFNEALPTPLIHSRFKEGILCRDSALHPLPNCLQLNASVLLIK